MGWGWVPGDYPVLAGYCTVRHYPDGYYSITLKYGRIRGICHDFCDSELYLTQSNAKWAFVLRLSLMFDTVTSHFTDNGSLGVLWERGVLRDSLSSHLTWCIAMCVLTDEAITQHDTLLLLQPLPSGLCLCYIHCLSKKVPTY